MKVQVQSGDTLLALTRRALRTEGADASAMPFKDVMAATRRVAEQNGIGNPDLIFAGQVIDFSSALRASSEGSAPSAVSAVSMAPPTQSAHRVLERTLSRAIELGYVPAADQDEVRRRILDMARVHKFVPDDFARVVLMESDGMNPKATNGNCHGIIQFCSGPDRGAASVGYGKNPEKILKLSTLEQLDLVDQYFADTGLSAYKPASLDTLYLTVLHPSSRQERQLHAPLAIPGPQARKLYEGADPNGAITRASLRKGLVENASTKLYSHLLAQQRGKPLPTATGTWIASRGMS